MKQDSALSEFFNQIHAKGIISGELLVQGISIFGNKFEKALFLVKNQSVIKLVGKPSGRIMWKIIGDNHDYILFPMVFCQCESFNITMSEKRTVLCKHLIAQALAESLNQYHTEEILDDEIPGLIKSKIQDIISEDK